MKEGGLIVPHPCGEVAKFCGYLEGAELGSDAVGREFFFRDEDMDRICLCLEGNLRIREKGREGQRLPWCLQP